MSQRVLGVAAHPDDLEWYAGGTLAKLARQGAEITFVICTGGDKGSYDANTDPRALAAQRYAEQHESAKFLGVAQVICLGYADGELQANDDLKKRLVALYRKIQPELVLAFDPWKRYELHPDHLAAGRAAVDARIAAKMPLFYPELRAEGLNAWAVRELWLFNADAPNHFVDVSETLETQFRALALHRSQSTVWDDAARQFIEQNARAHGRAIGVEYAEAFRRIVIESALVMAEGAQV